MFNAQACSLLVQFAPTGKVLGSAHDIRCLQHARSSWAKVTGDVPLHSVVQRLFPREHNNRDKIVPKAQKGLHSGHGLSCVF